MGNDAPLAAISERPRQLYDYFTQLFAQVTNPPLDAIREELVTSLQSQLGPEQQPARRRPGQLPHDRGAVPGARQRRPGQDRARSTTTASSPASPRTSSRGVFTGRGGRRRAAQAPRRDQRRGLGGHRRGRPADRAVQPRGQPRPGPDPVAAAHRCGAPPPGARAQPHPGRADRRVRRRPRGAPHRAADRLRRRRGQPVPGHGHRGGSGAARRHPRGGRRRRRPRTWSRRWARACARRCPRWACPRWPPTPAPRSSRRSASATK